MTQLRRTTVTAPQDTIRTLEAEAQRRRVPLATLLREAVVGEASPGLPPMIEAFGRSDRPRPGPR